MCFADATPLLERQHDPDEPADPPDDGPDDLAEAATPMETDAPAAPSNPAPPGGESEPQTFYDDIRSRVLRGLVRRRALRPAVKETDRTSAAAPVWARAEPGDSKALQLLP